jgi:nucleotide-binding universal stress UspA family protein
MPQAKATKPATVIVVGVDFEGDGDLALDTALGYASRLDRAEIHAVHVTRGLGRGSGAPPEEDRVPESRGERVLDELEARCLTRLEATGAAEHEDGTRRIISHVRVGRPADQIVQLAMVLDADLVVVGSRQRKGLKRVVLGSVAERVTRLAPCPVWVVRPKAYDDVEAPEIEPPCPDCVRMREETDGGEVWCSRHQLARFHPRPHRFSYGGRDVSSGGPESSASWGPRSG